MIAIAAIAMGVAANAATITWSATAIGLAGGQTATSETIASVAAGYLGMVIDATIWSDVDTALAAIKGGSSAGIISQTTGVVQGTKTDVFKLAVSTGAANTTLDAGDTWDVFMLVLNNTDASAATYYMTAADTKATKTVSAAGLISPTFGSQASNSWTAIPEPTSGLLMLLGVAGLALRRRRA